MLKNVIPQSQDDEVTPDWSIHHINITKLMNELIQDMNTGQIKPALKKIIEIDAELFELQRVVIDKL